MLAKTQADKDFFFATIPFEVSFREGGRKKRELRGEPKNSYPAKFFGAKTSHPIIKAISSA